jgi:hypothetical protein
MLKYIFSKHKYRLLDCIEYCLQDYQKTIGTKIYATDTDKRAIDTILEGIKEYKHLQAQLPTLQSLDIVEYERKANLRDWQRKMNKAKEKMSILWEIIDTLYYTER